MGVLNSQASLGSLWPWECEGRTCAPRLRNWRRPRGRDRGRVPSHHEPPKGAVDCGRQRDAEPGGLDRSQRRHPARAGPWDPFTGGVGEPLAQRSTRCSARAGKPSAGGAGRGDRARSRPPGGPAPGLPIGRVGGPRRLRGTAGPVSGAAIRGPLATQGGAGGAVRTAPRSMARRRRPAPSWSRSIPGARRAPATPVGRSTIDPGRRRPSSPASSAATATTPT